MLSNLHASKEPKELFNGNSRVADEASQQTSSQFLVVRNGEVPVWRLFGSQNHMTSCLMTELVTDFPKGLDCLRS